MLTPEQTIIRRLEGRVKELESDNNRLRTKIIDILNGISIAVILESAISNASYSKLALRGQIEELRAIKKDEL